MSFGIIYILILIKIFYLSVYDTWLLVSFIILFILIHIVFFVWYYNTYKTITELKKDELKFIISFNISNTIINLAKPKSSFRRDGIGQTH